MSWIHYLFSDYHSESSLLPVALLNEFVVVICKKTTQQLLFSFLQLIRNGWQEQSMTGTGLPIKFVSTSAAYSRGWTSLLMIMNSGAP